jgi:hypothetical protein
MTMHTFRPSSYYSPDAPNADANQEEEMKEIRLCWSARISHLKHEIQATATWQPLPKDLRLDYEIIAQAGNKVYGPGTHWSRSVWHRGAWLQRFTDRPAGIGPPARHTAPMRTKIKRGIVAVIIDSLDARNVGAMVNVEKPYKGPLPNGEERRTGWWIVLPKIPLISDANAAVVGAPDVTTTDGRCLMHRDSLLPLLAGKKPGTILRWDWRLRFDVDRQERHASASICHALSAQLLVQPKAAAKSAAVLLRRCGWRLFLPRAVVQLVDHSLQLKQTVRHDLSVMMQPPKNNVLEKCALARPHRL